MSKVVEINSGMDLESMRIAKEVATEEEFSDVLINASLDGILTYDLQCKYTLWSPSMERMTGVKSSEIIGRLAFDVFPFLKEAGFRRQYERSLQGEAVRSPVMRFEIPQTGNQGYSEQQNFPLYNELGEITGGLAIVRDVTLVKQRFDELAQKNRELEQRVAELEKKLAALQSSSTD
jgi:PAS domain S-box-containing protein